MDDVVIWIIISVVLSILGALKKDRKPGGSLPPFGGPGTEPEGPGEETPPTWIPQTMSPRTRPPIQPAPAMVTEQPGPTPGSMPQTLLFEQMARYSDKIPEWEQKYSQPSYNFFEDSPDSIQFSDISAPENQGETLYGGGEGVLEGFTGARAVVFSEIIRPKYFRNVL